jgi:hypothetical protein
MLMMCAFWLMICGVPAHAGDSEYQDKARKLLNFSMFLEWPSDAFSRNSSPFLIGIMGNDPFGHGLRDTFRNRHINGHPVEVSSLDDPAEAGAFHLIFICRSEQDRLDQVLPRLQNGHTLLVGDVDDCGDFCRWGGMVCLYMEKEKVRFHLNADAIKAAGIKMDSKIMRMAASTDCGTP